jgi:hypothetical protein
MAQGWSVDGRRVEFRAAFPAGKIVVLEGASEVHVEKLKAAGEWQLPVGGRSYTLKRTKGFMGPKTELFGTGGTAIPMTPKLVSPTPAPADARCATHQQQAGYACPRCGAFCCQDCAGPDLTHCGPCAKRQAEAAAKNAAAMAFMAPVPVFFFLGGPLAGLLTAAAGGIAVAIARRTESKALKIGAAIGLYGVATIVWLVVVALVMAAKDP